MLTYHVLSLGLPHVTELEKLLPRNYFSTVPMLLQVSSSNSTWEPFDDIFCFTYKKAFMLTSGVEFGSKISNQEAIYLITRLTKNEKETHLLWVAQCLGSLNYRVITDVLQNLLLTKFYGFYCFLWRESILFTQKYNNNFRVKLASYNIRFTEPQYTISHDIKSPRLAMPLCYECTCSPHVKILFVS